MHRHRAAVEAQLEQASGSPVVESTLRGLADRWDEIEQTGKDERQVPAIARAMLRTADHLTSHTDDILSQLEAELRGF
jgi:hypothetical protein